MAIDPDDFSFSHLFIAFPELIWEEALVSYLHSAGYITADGLRIIEKLRKSRSTYQWMVKRLKGRTAFERILAIAPELLNRKTIGILEKFGVIDHVNASKLRIYLGILERAGKGGKPKGILDSMIRLRKTFGFDFADNILSYLVSMGDLDRREANKIRAEMLAYRIVGGTLRDVVRAKSVLEMLLMTGSNLANAKTIEFLKLAGIIDTRIEQALLSSLGYGSSLWTVFEGSRRAEGLAARMAYLLSGSFSWELVEFFKVAKVLTPNQLTLLKVAVAMSQEYNRKLMEELTDRRYRVIPGESPIVTFLRASKSTEQEILSLLAEAADRARKEAEALADLKRVGAAARGAEYRLRVAALHHAMREIWEGNGFLTIFGERAAADAAVASADMLQTKYYKKLPDHTLEMLQAQARSGLDLFLSRKENTLPLSRRVYGNWNIWNKRIDKEINIGLLTGKSSSEIGKSVQKLINPKVMGGVKYAGMRLGRTELANAFHLTTIRHTREMPWVRGYKWNLSSSHGHSDVCNSYADDDHDGLGAGIFKKANVPGKPHPNCLCYITVVGVTEDQFVKSYNKGYYNQYLATMANNPGGTTSMAQSILLKASAIAGAQAGNIAASQGLIVLDKMMQKHPHKQVGINPVKALDKPAKVSWPDWIKNNPTLSSIADDIDFGDLPDPIQPPDEERIAAALKKFEKKGAAYRESLTGRQNHFYALAGKHEREIAHSSRKSFYKDEYDLIFDFNQGTPLDEQDAAASLLYGSSSYRMINKTLRSTKKSLSKYDDELTHMTAFKGELEKMGYNPNLVHWANLSQDQLDHFSQFMVDIDELKMHDPDAALYVGSMANLPKQILKSFSKPSEIVVNLDTRMEKTVQDHMLFRVAGPDFFQLKGGAIPSPDDIGHIFKDWGFTSTEGIPSYYDGDSAAEILLDLKRRPMKIRILAPEGTLAMRMNDVENEILLSRGSKFQIMNVENASDGTTFVDLFLISQRNIFGGGKNALGATEDDMWDAIMGDF